MPSVGAGVLSGLDTKMTLWGQQAIQFNVDAVYNSSEAKPVVAQFLGCLVKTYFGQDQLSGRSACKWYFNPEIPEAEELYHSYENQRIEIRHVASSSQQTAQPQLVAQLEVKYQQDLQSIDPYKFPENREWAEWQTGVLVKRNEVENVYHWACGHKDLMNGMMRWIFCKLKSLHLFQDVYFDDESAEVVISSLRLGDDQDMWLIEHAFCSSSLFTNSNWFTFDGDRGINYRLAASVPSPSPNSEETSLNMEETDEVLIGEATGTESQLESAFLENGPVEETKELTEDAKHNDASTDDEKMLCVEEENVSQEAEASEQHVDVQDGQTATQVGGASEGPSIDTGADEPCGSSEPDNALPGALPASGETDQSANSSGRSEAAHESASPAKVDEKRKLGYHNK
ncbi:hypothetical protein HU200_008822 [Digitaria exilis]|uniref:Uncharacterized protein n=1 Tax=Digitaria exilis TaxID=1010633 RepID=A0A835KT71_9POAL|nr:hypothetical protein HU200_008822 [Digitaria exilis]